MSSNVGLSTPRGSGTSGYVQRNMSFLRPRDNPAPLRDVEHKMYQQRTPNAEILAHDRKREVEVKCLELQDKLEEEEELDEEEIETRVQALRTKLLTEVDHNAKIDPRNLKPHQVHELAAAKMVESERLRSALGISKDYEEGSHWRRQEEEKIKRLEQRERPEGGNGGGGGGRGGGGRREGGSGGGGGRRRSASPPRWREASPRRVQRERY